MKFESMSFSTTYEDNDQAGSVGVDHAGVLSPGADAAEEGDYEDDHTWEAKNDN